MGPTPHVGRSAHGQRRCRPGAALAGLWCQWRPGVADRHRDRALAPGAVARRPARRRMTTEVLTAVLFIAVPIAFNLAFFELGRAFEYPGILRKEPDEILRRFAAGGPGLILRWEALLVSALLMLPIAALLVSALLVLPIAALLAVVLAASPALTVLSLVFGATAALVQELGLVRWPFAVPELARRYVAAPDGAARRASSQPGWPSLGS